MTDAGYTGTTVRKLLKREKRPGLFGGKYRFSPYMACGHRCIYCDGRFEKYHVQGDFDRDIVARTNTPELLEKELGKLREAGPVCISSGVSDPYQPVEEGLNLTGRAAEILARGSRPVVIHTKSSLLLRDIETWAKLNRTAPVTVMVSLTMNTDGIREWLEPGASTVEERLRLLRECASRGISTGVLAMPFIPFLTDGSHDLSSFAEMVRGTGASFAMPGLLTLKEGRQKGFFFSALRKSMPELVEPLLKLYSTSGPWGEPPEDYSREFWKRARKAWEHDDLDSLIPHRLYAGQFSLYDEFTILLDDMQTLYRDRGTGVKKLRRAAERFRGWVGTKRSFIARRRNLSYGMIDDYLRVMTHSGELEELLENKRLAKFLAEVESGALFDYRTLELRRKVEG